jgi:hypothetical protein
MILSWGAGSGNARTHRGLVFLRKSHKGCGTMSSSQSSNRPYRPHISIEKLIFFHTLSSISAIRSAANFAISKAQLCHFGNGFSSRIVQNTQKITPNSAEIVNKINTEFRKYDIDWNVDRRLDMQRERYGMHVFLWAGYRGIVAYFRCAIKQMPSRFFQVENKLKLNWTVGVNSKCWIN